MKFRTNWLALVLPLVALMVSPSVLSAQNADLAKIKKALKISPKQKGIDFDMPAADDLEQCQLGSGSKAYGVPGWVVIDESSRVVRVFLDTNKDGDLDQWSFYKNGIEVYRDVDSNFDSKVDQYRWMGTAGRRWGVDSNQDGVIDAWKAISAEEVAEEVFLAIQTRDARRFDRLLITGAELKSLELGEKMYDVTAKSVAQARVGFAKVARAQKLIGRKSSFVDFGSARPALVPQGREGIEQDLIIYDHAQSLYGTGEKYGQISLGTIVQVGNSWRVLETPEMMTRSNPAQNGGLFFPLQSMVSPIADTANPTSEKLNKMFEEYESLEEKLANARPGVVTQKLQKQRADLYVRMINEHNGSEDRKNWIRQMSDTVSSAYQQDLYPDGLRFLNAFLKAERAKRRTVGLDYVEYRIIQSRNHSGMQGDRESQAKANTRYIEDLEDYVGNFPRGEFTPEALMQLALFSEVSDDRDGEEQAIQWYEQIRKSFPDSNEASKAQGAMRRLTSIGRTIPYRAKAMSGDQTFDLSAYRGRKMVVVHFWASWCDSCVEDFDELKRLRAKYKDELSVIGANVDEDAADAKAVLRKAGVTWPQLWEEGGIEGSAVATQLGVTTLPLTILIDKDGKVLENEIGVNDLDRDVQRAIRNASKSASNRDEASPRR